MKSTFHSLVTFAVALFSAGMAGAQVQLPPIISERGPHHRVWQRTSIETLPDGKTRSKVSSYVELATGMHFERDGQWVGAREEVEIFKDGAIARNGQHQVIFSPNVRTEGAIDLLSPDGKRFRSHVLGLAYTDSATGQSVLIAETKDSIGEVAGNQVIYRDAFDGSFQADVRYTYTRHGFEQDVILRETPPSPAEYNMDPATTRLEVWTEFLDPPVPTKTTSFLKPGEEQLKPQARFDAQLSDEALDFGITQIGGGTAFPLETPAGAVPDEVSIPVGKNWTRTIEGRDVLIEKVDYTDIEAHMAQLPRAAALNNPPAGQRQAAKRGGSREVVLAALPRPARKEAKPANERMRMAALTPPGRGFVVDYVHLLTQADFTFKGDTTYYVSNATVTLSGTTTIEGGAVVKYTNYNTSRILITGPIDCRTSQYRPAFFVARDDDTVGETISGSSGNPGTNLYAGRALDLNAGNITNRLSHLRFRHCDRPIYVTAGSLELSHTQVGNSRYLLWDNVSGSLAKLRNVLGHDLQYALLTSSVVTNSWEHVTLHRVGTLRSSGAGTIAMTNCLLISVTNYVAYSGSAANVYSNASDTGIFQTVGAAARYLATNSPHRDVGTTNINGTLLSDISRRTTYPPLVLSNAIASDTTLTPQAQRDTDTPDLGYLYDPLDFVFAGVILTNSTLTATSGVALGTYRSPNVFGLSLWDGARFFCEGSPTNLNRIVAYNTVQEQASTNWAGVGHAVATKSASAATPPPQTRFRFTEWSKIGQQDEHYIAYAACEGTNDVLDCQFHGGKITIPRPKFNFTNCLFNRVGTLVDDDYGSYTLTPIFQNVTFNGGRLDLIHQSADTWKFRDCLFNNVTNLSQDGIVDHDYNAYTTNSNRLTNNAANDKLVTVTNIAFEKGPLGYFYLPTNLTSHSALFNNGRTNANLLGLYHFTTTTNQFKETNSLVDFGFHYVAVNTDGIPIDSDGDGLGDYLEDVNGNGSLDSGETKTSDATDWGLRVLITRPRNGGNIP